jgi:hypothetical protein
METSQQPLDLPELAITSLGAHISKCFSEAETAKQPIIERLLKCQRQRRGEYEPQLRAQIKAIGGQEIYMMVTDIKCRAADSWIKDVLLNHEDSTWGLRNTAEPDLPPEIDQEIESVVMQEAAAVAAQGVPVNPATLPARRAEIADQAAQAVREEAEKRRERMERRIADKMQEGRWKTALGEIIYDFTTYPAAFVKGPILRKKKKMTWGANFQPIVQEVVVMEYDRVSPFDIYPSPGAVDIQDGYLIHRHKLSRVALRQMASMAGADPEAIKQVLQVYRNGYSTTRPGDTERDQLNSRNSSFGPDGLIEALEYWGPASGQSLVEWGIVSYMGREIDVDAEYQINAWKVGSYVIRAVINPDPLDQRPYGKACFEEVPGSFWGLALPEMMADVQTICNAAARALAMNMGIASGPQVEVTRDRLAPGENVTTMYPWKQYQVTSDRSGGGQAAIRFFQPDMHASELLGIYSHFSRVADEVTGVPNYVYGSSNVSGAGRTASGLQMLMENAAKGIKHAILNLDAACSGVVARTYTHLMLHDPDQAIKGDMQVIAAGAIGAMIRDRQVEQRSQILAQTANPIDSQIIGPANRAYMLRETIKGIFPEIDKAVPAPEVIQAAMQAQQQAMQEQQAMAVQQQQQQQMPA